MSEEQGSVEEETTSEGNGAEGTSEQSQGTGATKEDFEFLKNQNEQLSQQVNRLLASLQPKAAETAPGLTREEMAAVTADPNKIGDIVNAKLTQATHKLTEDQRRAQFDARAEAEFPAMKTDEKFKREVLAAANELMAQDGTPATSPTLLYRAAQLAAAKRAVSGNNKGVTSNMPTSESPATGRPRQAQGTAKIDDNDPRIVAAKTIGLSKEQVDRLKKTLPAYVPSQRKQGRVLTRESR